MCPLQCLCPKKAPPPSGCSGTSRPSPPVVPTRCLCGIMHRRTQGTLAGNVRAGNAGEGPLMPRGMTRGPQGVAAPFGRADRLPIRPCSRTKPDTLAPLASGGTDDSASQRATGLPELTRRHRRRVCAQPASKKICGTSSSTAMGTLLPFARAGIHRSAPKSRCSSLDTGERWERERPLVPRGIPAGAQPASKKIRAPRRYARPGDARAQAHSDGQETSPPLAGCKSALTLERATAAVKKSTAGSCIQVALDVSAGGAA